ncbi:MAG: GNAT family acetyltransferase [Clostridiales bacterium]|nr:GNAT family acetyltransferase [Clostridiales bacterium]
MIQTEDILNMNFYERGKFTGSQKGMRYLIEKSKEQEDAVFQVIVWPGPYNFEATPDEAKTSAVFPFTLAGKQQVVDWLNEQWQSRMEEWQVS